MKEFMDDLNIAFFSGEHISNFVRCVESVKDKKVKRSMLRAGLRLMKVELQSDFEEALIDFLRR